MQKRSNQKRIWRSILCMLFVMVMVTAELAPAMAAVTQADIDALKGDASSLSKQKKELEQKLAALSKDKSQTLKRKNLLDEQIAALDRKSTLLHSSHIQKSRMPSSS